MLEGEESFFLSGKCPHPPMTLSLLQQVKNDKREERGKKNMLYTMTTITCLKQQSSQKSIQHGCCAKLCKIHIKGQSHFFSCYRICLNIYFSGDKTISLQTKIMTIITNGYYTMLH